MIKEIYEDGTFKLKNNNLIKIIRVKPQNYNLKSDLEKKSILSSYKNFLKSCEFEIQILIQSSKEDLREQISGIKNNISKKENFYLKEIGEGYINYISKLNSIKKSSTKNFYIVISKRINKEDNSEELIRNELKDNYIKIKENLSRCGNFVTEINNEKEVKNLFFSFLCIRKNFNLKINNLKLLNK